MKIETPIQFSGVRLRAASSRFILTGMIAAAAGFALAVSGSAQTTQGVSAFPFFIDGHFSNGVGVGEWSDVTPSAFHSAPGATAAPVALNDPTRNTLLYAALGTTAGAPVPSLHLLYDFLPRTNQFVAPGEIFASVTFPINLPPALGGNKRNVSVLFQGKALALKDNAGVATSFFDIFVDLDLDGIGDVTASSLGLEGAAAFGPSPLAVTPHLIVELGVGLRIQPGFGTQPGPLPGGGINPATGLYDPDPAFWGAAGGTGGGATLGPAPLQSASSGIFTINPNGSTTIIPTPEPSSAVLLLGSLGMLAARRRKAA